VVKKYTTLLFIFFVVSLLIIFSFYFLIFLANFYQSVMFENKDSSLTNFLNFDVRNAFTTMFISSVISFIFCMFVGGLIAKFFIEQSKRDKFLNKFYIFILLLNLLIASLAIFNTDQFSVLVGAISLAALIWPRFKP